MKPVTGRRGIIVSSGGSALIAATQCLKTAGKNIDWVVVTDRDCGGGQWAEAEGYKTHHIEYADAQIFSTEAYRIFATSACSDVLLFFTRRVASPLIDSLRVWNIHPGLLPAFPGLHAVDQALAAQARVLGATLHRVDAGLDTGPIVAQAATHLQPGISVKHAHRLSFLQKVWLTLVWIEQTSLKVEYESVPANGPNGTGVLLACPGLATPALRASYNEWVAQLEMGGR